MLFSKSRPNLRVAAGCFGLTIAALLVHGYHMGTDDAAIWVPAIKKAADPSLYPFGGEFFLTHAHHSLFPLLVGTLARLTHLSPDLVIFLCHIAGVFLLLLASWYLLSTCFEHDRARWTGVALLAGLLSVPVAGTAIPIMDPYVTSRTLSTPLALFAIAAYLSAGLRRATGWILACALMHPQMSFYAMVLIGAMELSRRRALVPKPVPVFGALSLALPFVWNLEPAHGAAREALLSRTYFFVSNWTWYEWLGVACPLALLWWLARMRLSGDRPILRELLNHTVRFGLWFTAAGLLLASSPHFENYTRLQPMRAFQLVYILLFLVIGAVMGEYLLERRRWLLAFVPLAIGMWLAAGATFPHSPHIESPGAAPQGEWSAAFGWIRDHTPKDAVFALDPDYLLLPGEDMHGFRAVAERSALADRVKDSGAVSLFPQLALDWDEQVRAQSGWNRFDAGDFQKLGRQYPVTWIVARAAPSGFDCPYRSESVAVCEIPGAGSGPGARRIAFNGRRR